jgi:hypothetical protein
MEHCTRCGGATRICFSTLDGCVAAALQAGLDGIDFADVAGRAFDQARPLAPGERGLDGACASCGMRFRIIATGGEQSREGALEYHLHDVLEDGGSVPSIRRVRINILILTLVFIAAGAGFLIPGIRAEQQRIVLVERGITTTARITDETRRVRGVPSVDVSFSDRDGTEHAGTFVVPLASGWHLGDPTIDVIYDPQAPSHVVAASGGLRHRWGFLSVGVGLILLGLAIGARLLARTQS